MHRILVNIMIAGVTFLAAILHLLNGVYVSRTSYLFKLSRFNRNVLHSFESLSSVSLSECLMTCYVRHQNCLSISHNELGQFCKIAGVMDANSVDLTNTGWEFYGK